ncbi:uncharacterized protein LOC132282083 [Cornus florida]|uniref:uncharacterized protein LOC132282083 n=1 Tax=Cornus florida TaxID=4283 RepID=UPI00289F7D76|nr:uncharacterized protein LOC132282083 [Cornus florida]
MHPPVREQHLLLYFTSTDKFIGALLAQTVDGQERPVYYLSRLVREAEAPYSAIERHCLALFFATQKFRHYFMAHHIHLITKCDPYRHVLSKPIILGKASRWLLALSEFDITCYAPQGIKSQALAYLLVWRGRHVLTSPTQQVTAAVKLAFRCSNNEAEYETLILSLLAVLDKGISRLCVCGDSKLVVKQVTDEYAISEPSFTSYRTIIQKLLMRFSSVHFLHVPRSNNKYPDALATLASKLTITDDMTEIRITKRIGPVTIAELFLAQIVSDNDWRAPIISQLKQRTGSLPLTQLKSFQLLQGLLYFHLPCGMLARCLGPRDAEAALIPTHEQHCATPLMLYRRLQR